MEIEKTSNLDYDHLGVTLTLSKRIIKNESRPTLIKKVQTGIRNKIHELKILLNLQQIDVGLISETHLTKKSLIPLESLFKHR